MSKTKKYKPHLGQLLWHVDDQVFGIVIKLEPKWITIWWTDLNECRETVSIVSELADNGYIKDAGNT